MTQETQKLTWAELKEFCNGLSQEQLSKPVIYWTEDGAGKIAFAWQLEEDYYRNPSDEEGCISESDFKEINPECDINEAERVYTKGTPLLEVDF